MPDVVLVLSGFFLGNMATLIGFLIYEAIQDRKTFGHCYVPMEVKHRRSDISLLKDIPQVWRLKDGR